MSEQAKITPLMQQFHAIKTEFPDALLLFQVGDFYELFFEDAQRAAAFLGITLTTRGKHLEEAIPLCGIPVHTKDHYIAKLVKGGFKVALCDQLEQPQPGKVVLRGVTQVFTPGTLAEAQLLDEKSASYLLSFFPTHGSWGVLFGELLTSQLFATIVPAEQYKILDAELVRFFPDEILLPETTFAKSFKSYFSSQGFYTTVTKYEEAIDAEEVQWLDRVQGLQKKEDLGVIQNALKTFYGYIKKNQKGALSEFTKIQFYKPEDFLVMDASTQRHLELVKNNQDGSRANTLFSLLDKAATPMGSRLIKKWIVRPLIKQESIAQRHDVVACIVRYASFAQQLYQVMRAIGDIERIVGRIAIKRGSLIDYVQLGKSVRQFPLLVQLLEEQSIAVLLNIYKEACTGFEDLEQLLFRALNDDSEKSWIIKQGYDARLDEVRSLVSDGASLMLALERQEQERTGINSLKIRYNALHGYYIEITKANTHLIPAEYIRYQMLVGKERYTTAALKELEQKIVTAEQASKCLEQEIFETVKSGVVAHIQRLRKAAYALSNLDALLAFSMVAYTNNYVRPEFTDTRNFAIQEGRHPIVEQRVGSRFIPNDTFMDDTQSLWIITGPNMGGKSTFLRQTALIALMAQCGSFVPAKKALLPLFDAVFTRIGAHDNVAEGKSTFLVEMEETAHICSAATKNSLLILDEVGRGTSTFDGLAIAYAVVEYIHTKLNAFCLFATHYHELTNLEKQFSGIVSYHAASRKTVQGILLLYKILKGVADGSFGLEVAKLAQLPSLIIERAHQVIELFDHTKMPTFLPALGGQIPSHESDFLRNRVQALEHEIAFYKQRLAEFNSLDLDNITPRQALDYLWSLKNQ